MKKIIWKSKKETVLRQNAGIKQAENHNSLRRRSFYHPRIMAAENSL